MPRTPPVVGTKAPVKTGGTGGGLSTDSVKAAITKKPAPAVKETPRNMRMETRSRSKQLDET